MVATIANLSDRRTAVNDLGQYIASSIRAGRANDEPFFHLQFDHVFPQDIYAAILTAMPTAQQYRPMSGPSERRARLYKLAPILKASGPALPELMYTRVKFDLFPEIVRSLSPDQRPIWSIVSRALRLPSVKEALVDRLAPGLERRFGVGFAKVGMYPNPTLMRDIPGYWLGPHRDTRWKGITVQFYLPSDNDATHVGTVFHQQMPDGTLVRHMQMKFAPNVGYAFAVGDNTWHSVDPVSGAVNTRDSILLTYYVDEGPLRLLRNRGRRVGNFVVNKGRKLFG